MSEKSGMSESFEETKLIIREPEELSIFDDAYPIRLFSDSLSEQMEKATETAGAIYNMVIKDVPAAAAVSQAVHSAHKEVRFVVDISDEKMSQILCGQIKLSAEKGGQLVSQVRNADGTYGEKFPIKLEEFGTAFDPMTMAAALQMRALQNQVEQISDQLNIIDHNVKEVLQGQQNDRISLYYSAAALFAESQTIQDKQLRNDLMLQALGKLTDCTFRLTLTMKSDIRYLVNGEYKSAKGKRVEQIEQKMQNINQAFAYIHQSFILRAAIYCRQGEPEAMAAVLKEYSEFIETVVAKNAGLLAQCDIRDDGTLAGIWNTRAGLKLDVTDLIRQMKEPEKVIYIGRAS